MHLLLTALGCVFALTLGSQGQALAFTPTTEDSEDSGSEDTSDSSPFWQVTTERQLILRNCPKELLLCRLENDSYRPYECANYGIANNSQLVYCNSLYCEPEQFIHDYIIRNHDQSPHTNKWKRARIGEAATLHDVCLFRNGLPVTRKCQVKAMRAQWESLDGWPRPVVCLRRVRERTISVELNSLHDDILEDRQRTNNTQLRRQTTRRMRRMFREPQRTVLPADVHVTSQVFSALMEEEKDGAVCADLVSVCKDIMSSDATTLRISARLNATNSLLSRFEEYMDGLPRQMVPEASCGKAVVRATSEPVDTEVEVLNFAHIGVQARMTGNLSVFFVNPQCDDITGIAIYSAATPNGQLKRSSNGFWYRFLHSNENLESLKREADLEIATFVPKSLWQELRDLGVNFLVFKVYGNDALFVETAEKLNRKPRSKVLSISIPELRGSTLPQMMPLLLRNENNRQPDARALTAGSGCGYWNYHTWLTDGVITSPTSNVLHDPVIVCHTHHLTQFSFLVGGSYRLNNLGEEVLVTPFNERVLDIISIVGCSLSLFGLIGIFLTAAIFKSWRSQASTKVLLNLCLAMSLQMVLFVFLNTDEVSEELVSGGHNLRCVVLGAFMQYSILVLFSWMLIIAFLQFQRYVTVVGIERPRHYILKAALVAWLLPLLPTLLVALIDPHSYLPSAAQLATDTGICYPSGYGLTFGVVLPVTLITLANLVIFVYVFYSISHSLSQSIHKAERQMVIKQIRLSILLFFLLGLSWIFGIFAFMQAGVAFSYLFCLTATMQGFVLFVYFVLLDEVNRRAWLGLCWPTKMSLDVQKRSAELQSMTTTSSQFSRKSQH